VQVSEVFRKPVGHLRGVDSAIAIVCFVILSPVARYALPTFDSKNFTASRRASSFSISASTFACFSSTSATQLSTMSHGMALPTSSAAWSSEMPRLCATCWVMTPQEPLNILRSASGCVVSEARRIATTSFCSFIIGVFLLIDRER
jgi:hypothetical protein